MTPKFLHALESFDDDSREFILHTQEPRVLIEFVGDLGTIMQWFDEMNDYMSRCRHAGKEPAQELARLMREAGDFFQTSP